MPTRTRKPRIYQPRPSPAARARILGAVRALLTDPDAKGWTAGYAVELCRLAELLADGSLSLSYSTLRNYVRCLVASGELVRLRTGIYALPQNSAEHIDRA